MKYLLIHYIDESILSWDKEDDQALEAWDTEMPTAKIGTFELRLSQE